MLSWSLNHIPALFVLGEHVHSYHKELKRRGLLEKKTKKERKGTVILHKSSRKSICLPNATSHIHRQPLPRPQGLLYNASGHTSVNMHKSNNSSELLISSSRCRGVAGSCKWHNKCNIANRMQSNSTATIYLVTQSFSWRSPAERQDVF